MEFVNSVCFSVVVLYFEDRLVTIFTKYFFWYWILFSIVQNICW